MRAETGKRRPRASLPRAGDFEAVYRAGVRRPTPAGTVYVLRRLGSEVRVGIPVARRFGQAVERNRVRRRVREALRQLPLGPGGVDIIVVPRAAASDMPFSKLVGVLETALREAGVTVSQRKDGR